jgi:hypothetical protein
MVCWRYETPAGIALRKITLALHVRSARPAIAALGRRGPSTPKPEALAARNRRYGMSNFRLVNYKLDGFSVERLMTFLTGLGSDIEIRIRKPKRAADRIGRILIEAA